MSVNYNGGGSYQYNTQIMSNAGAAPVIADVDAFFVAVLPVAGAWASVTIAAQPDVPRNVTFLVTDGDSGITSGYLEITGTDSQGRALQETITFGGGGTATVTGLYAFKTITSARYIVAGVVSGADRVQGGYGNTLGLPYAIASISDIKNRWVSVTGAGVGTLSIPGGTHGVWIVSAADAPDGTNRYYVSTQSTAS